ncbi:sugar-binding transcriptional regulator [Streptococcus cuniculi]|uniref:Sugar-binding transcriptional regulator n=1 Tax=Streptococcus cuniculi TaxID=1432788 RepID=A0A4Y9JE50_9STRE|nr:sugar-binding transcriptional regulator [Streptococcus cuniculi]MBF0777929.1 sugar-binding transcriptional regulator [Streptococcus cuniculi]TFU98224.1 sugar-binding transcriptional regulator [Streptococcus cuniculi]
MEKYTEKDYVKVAVMYYDEGMTQAEIAKKLKVSRSLISKILIDAREAKIVEVFINSQSVVTAKLEREIEKRFNVSSVVVVDTDGLSVAEIKRKVSRAAAGHCESYIKRNTNIRSIGVSWGETLKYMIDYFPYVSYPQIHIYPLVGGMGNEYFYLHSNQLVQTLAQKMGALAHYLYVPAMVSSVSLKEELERDSTISCVMDESRNVDFAIVGLASLIEESTMTRTGYISHDDVEQFKQLGIIGDINSQFFGRHGESDFEINRHVVGLSIEDIKNIPAVMAVSYGEEKADAIKVALENQLLNMLVTTDKTAKKLLSM